MSKITTFASHAMLNHLFTATGYTPGPVWVGLSTTLPTIAGTNVTEPSGGAYGRVLVDWDPASGRVITNSDDIIFEAATADWGSMAYLVIYDAETSGNLIGWDDIDNGPIIINETMVMKFKAGDIEFSLAATGLSTYAANLLLDLIFGGVDFDRPTLRLGLSTTTPTDAGTSITEPSGGSYAKVLVPDWLAAASRTVKNDGPITMPTSSGAWGEITYYFLIDADDNYIISGALDDPIDVSAPDEFEFDDQTINISIV